MTARALRGTRVYMPRALAGLLCLLASAGTMLAIPPLLGNLVATLPTLALDTIGLLAGLILAGTFLRFGGSYWVGTVASRVVIDVRKRLFGDFVAAPSSFHDRHLSADLVAVLTHDALFVENTLTGLGPALVLHLPVVLVAGVLVFVNNWQVAALLALGSIPVVVLILAMGRVLRRNVRAGHETIGAVSVVAQEAFLENRLLKSLSEERYLLTRFERLAERLYEIKRTRVVWRALLDALLPLSALVLAALAAWVMHHQLVAGTTTAGDVTTFVTYLGICGVSAVQLVRSYAGLENLIGAQQRLNHVRPATTEPLAGLPATDAWRAAGRVVFDRVSFHYPEERGGLHDVSLCIEPGECVAITGPNGSGKSTLISLLLRLYEPASGRIRLDDTASDAIDLAAWRRQFAVVFRDPGLFSVSIEDNIRLGNTEASQADLERAARAVGLHGYITNLPQGYHTPIGEKGVRLSAGQRQRLALARALLRDPSVVIFDEALNSLDAESERIIGDVIRSWAGRRTVILISHNPIQNLPLSRIIRLQQGQITGETKVERPAEVLL